ncbi:DNA mismatch repair ATPase msh1 [Asimina triloba]
MGSTARDIPSFSFSIRLRSGGKSEHCKTPANPKPIFFPSSKTRKSLPLLQELEKGRKISNSGQHALASGEIGHHFSASLASILHFSPETLRQTILLTAIAAVIAHYRYSKLRFVVQLYWSEREISGRNDDLSQNSARLKAFDLGVDMVIPHTSVIILAEKKCPCQHSDTAPVHIGWEWSDIGNRLDLQAVGSTSPGMHFPSTSVKCNGPVLWIAEMWTMYPFSSFLYQKVNIFMLFMAVAHLWKEERIKIVACIMEAQYDDHADIRHKRISYPIKAEKVLECANKATGKSKESKFLPDEENNSHIVWWKEEAILDLSRVFIAPRDGNYREEARLHPKCILCPFLIDPVELLLRIMPLLCKPSIISTLTVLIQWTIVITKVYDIPSCCDVIRASCAFLKEGTLNMELLKFKSRFPREVLLCRVGEFYEAVGFDACVLVEHAGLNPFGGLRSDSIPRAGCPVMELFIMSWTKGLLGHTNLQQTLVDLTDKGFSVCIVEEIQAPTQARSRKSRFISGHAHPGSPYVFGLAGVDHDVDFPEPMPVVGISRSAKGYCMISVVETTKTYSDEDGLTEEAIVTKLRTCRYHYLFLHKSLRHNPSGSLANINHAFENRLTLDVMVSLPRFDDFMGFVNWKDKLRVVHASNQIVLPPPSKDDPILFCVQLIVKCLHEKTLKTKGTFKFHVNQMRFAPFSAIKEQSSHTVNALLAGENLVKEACYGGNVMANTLNGLRAISFPNFSTGWSVSVNFVVLEANAVKIVAASIREEFEWEILVVVVRELYGIDQEVTFRNVTVSSEKRPRPLYMKDLLLSPPPYEIALAIQTTCKRMSSITCSIPEFTCLSATKTVSAQSSATHYGPNIQKNKQKSELPFMMTQKSLDHLATVDEVSAEKSFIMNLCHQEGQLQSQIVFFLLLAVKASYRGFTNMLVKLLESKETNHIEFRRIKNVVDEILLMYGSSELHAVLQALLDPTWMATGLKIECETLAKGCELISHRIGDIIFLDGETDHEISSFPNIPEEFFEDIESSWKGRVKRVHAEKAFVEVEKAAEALSKAVTEDFLPILVRIKAVVSPLGGPKGEIAYAREHEAVWFKGKRFAPFVWSGGPGEEQIKLLKPATDSRRRKVGEEWFTTSKVDEALNRYHAACAKARAEVLDLLRGLSSELQTEINVLIFSSIEGRRRKWVFPTLSDLPKSLVFLT